MLASPNRRCCGETVIADTCPLRGIRASILPPQVILGWRLGRREHGNGHLLPVLSSSFRLAHDCTLQRESNQPCSEHSETDPGF